MRQEGFMIISGLIFTSSNSKEEILQSYINLLAAITNNKLTKHDFG
jgi:hypothetical protein